MPRLVKGSEEAKEHMAKLRAMRKEHTPKGDEPKEEKEVAKRVKELKKSQSGKGQEPAGYQV